MQGAGQEISNEVVRPPRPCYPPGLGQCAGCWAGSQAEPDLQLKPRTQHRLREPRTVPPPSWENSHPRGLRSGLSQHLLSRSCLLPSVLYPLRKGQHRGRDWGAGVPRPGRPPDSGNLRNESQAPEAGARLHPGHGRSDTRQSHPPSPHHGAPAMTILLSFDLEIRHCSHSMGQDEPPKAGPGGGAE